MDLFKGTETLNYNFNGNRTFFIQFNKKILNINKICVIKIAQINIRIANADISNE